ncbi:MAG TPA: hypothetical protein VI160_04045 [Gemmatimonadales bacterium]
MNARISGLIGVAAVFAGVAACHKDPTAAGAGVATQVVANFDTLAVKAGATTQFVASVVDQDLTPLPNAVSLAVCSGGSAFASVAKDGSYHPEPNTSTRAIVTGIAAGSTCVVASSGSVKPDTVHVTVN